MREAAALARAYAVHLHTHLAENDNDVAFSIGTSLAPTRASMQRRSAGLAMMFGMRTA